MAALLLALNTPAGIAQAHDGAPPGPHDLATAWSWEPAVLIGLALAGWAYARGVGERWRRAGRGRGIRGRQAAAFAGGLATLFLALVSPLDAWGSALFAAHMVQHLLLSVVAAPLLVLGAPTVPFLWALPLSGRRRIGAWRRRAAVRAGRGVLGHPMVAWTLQALALWVWHLPGLYQAALRHEALHAFEHASFFGTSVLFWWTIVRAGAPGRPGYGVALLSLFATALQSGGLGALITFARTPWYPVYAVGEAAWGLTPIDDQQLAGLIMWVPAGLVYAVAASILVVVWLQAAEREARRGEPSSSIRSLPSDL